jgi:hypothetical protein
MKKSLSRAQLIVGGYRCCGTHIFDVQVIHRRFAVEADSGGLCVLFLFFVNSSLFKLSELYSFILFFKIFFIIHSRVVVVVEQKLDFFNPQTTQKMKTV